MTADSVELMRTLDEKFIASRVAFETMHPTGTMIVDGSGLRAGDGSLDRDLIRRLVERASWRFLPLRLRLRSMPFGVTTPAWVADGAFELGDHIRILEAVAPHDVPAVLAGDANPPLDLHRPLWSVVVAGLPDGSVAIVPRFQHAFGDGLFCLRSIEALSDAEPGEVELVPGEAPHSPGSSAGVLRVAFRQWRARQSGFAGAWHEYWRKPFVRRLRRSGGRIMRSRRMRDELVDIPGRVHAVTTVPFGPVKRGARALGGSVHDVIVAAAMTAVAGLEPQRGVALLVPISRRAGSTGDERNNIAMAGVVLGAGLSLQEAVASVATQVATAAAGEAPAVSAKVPWAGYASFLPWRPRVRWVGAGELRSLALWPVLDPAHRLGVFACSYADRLTIAVSTSLDLDADELLAGVLDRLSSAEAEAVADRVEGATA